MRAAIINLSETQKRRLGQNPGLILQRYAAESDLGPQKANLIQDAIEAGRSRSLRDLYEAAFKRWVASFPDDGLHPARELTTYGRMIVGLGTPNVLEAGLRLHHVYGVPLIPGSALKGLAAHYCREVWGEGGSAQSTDGKAYRQEGEFYDVVFGRAVDGGVVTFHDAWITPDSLPAALHLDVLTTHHHHYNRNPDDNQFRPPTDFDSPVPIPFVSVSGTFLVRLSWCGPSRYRKVAPAWLERTFEILEDALGEWGVGGKTSSGYGRLGDARALAGPQGDTLSKAGATPSEPIHSPHTKKRFVKRTVAGKVRFEADDGFFGSLLTGPLPELADGDAVELWILRVDKRNKTVPYVLLLEPPVKK